jgi:hypothetical protein
MSGWDEEDNEGDTEFDLDEEMEDIEIVRKDQQMSP